MATVHIPVPMRQFSANQSQVQVGPGVLSAVFSELYIACPGLKTRICDVKGAFKSHINIFVNGRDIRTLDGDTTAVHENDEVHIVPAIAGG